MRLLLGTKRLFIRYREPLKPTSTKRIREVSPPVMSNCENGCIEMRNEWESALNAKKEGNERGGELI